MPVAQAPHFRLAKPGKLFWDAADRPIVYDDHGRHDLLKPGLRPWKGPLDYERRPIRRVAFQPRRISVAERMPVPVPAIRPQYVPAPILAPRQRLPLPQSVTERRAERNLAYRTKQEAVGIRQEKALARRAKATVRATAQKARQAAREERARIKLYRSPAALKMRADFARRQAIVALGERRSRALAVQAARRRAGKPYEKVAPKAPKIIIIDRARIERARKEAEKRRVKVAGPGRAAIVKAEIGG